MKFHPEKKYLQSVVLFAAHKTGLSELADELRSEDFNVYPITKISEMLKLLDGMKPDAFVMDFSENAIACLEFCYAIKSNSELAAKPVLIISDKYEERNEIEAFSAGADDFIIKPLQMAAFLQRLKTRMRAPKEIMTFKTEKDNARLRIDREGFAVFVDNTPLDLSKKEFELLYILASHPGKNFSREELSKRVWREPLSNNNRTIDVHIVRLRKKIGKQYIKTLKGVGYRFSAT
jgi:two-component system alkaline phosphatase synthesis response regulator PhoP